jgi:16S rRNA (adenine1518-N6/adenine1519-N6)-dimethyltransferase
MASKIHTARKRFGQNFLTDPEIIRRIVAAIHPTPDQHLVEIGPGQGAITADLVASGCQLDLVELDRDLVPLLRDRFAGKLLGAAEPRLRIHSADALKFDFGGLHRGQPLRIVGNLPYNISTPLIFHLLAYADLIGDMHFMLQLEVVNRLAAAPGGKAWGKLGVMAQYHCQVDKLFEVPPGAFRPAPRVQSAIVRLVPRSRPDAAPGEPERLRRVVQAAFAQRRKTLRNTLRDLVSVQQLEQLGISPGARAETLDLQQFIAISHCIDQPESR